MDTTLVVLAAGMGSRFGGLKQMTGLGPSGEMIADYSVYDAIKAGFTKIVYVIKKEFEEDFIEKVSSKIKGIKVELAFQDLQDLPGGFNVPAERKKPWGTSHALWAARNVVNEPFMVISADDFYGRGVFTSMHNFLAHEVKDCADYTFAMPGHILANTVSDYGSVSRAICTVENGFLVNVRELRKIEKKPEGIGHDVFGEFEILADDTIVNMLVFGFSPAIFAAIEEGFADFFDAFPNAVEEEYFLNNVVKKLILDKKATMRVLPVTDRWMGMTYPQDLPIVQKALSEMIARKLYPTPLF
ncbi:MAG: sugar phosphate nucleotidyltransferase [Defluviitaleaceae bacterium]|nr:sugar phosphate nucleotidyltransferase [Defluviitaleaceae bacterium]